MAATHIADHEKSLAATEWDDLKEISANLCGRTVDAFDYVPGSGRQLFGHHEPLDFAGGSQFGVQRSFIELKPDVATRLCD